MPRPAHCQQRQHPPRCRGEWRKDTEDGSSIAEDSKLAWQDLCPSQTTTLMGSPRRAQSFSSTPHQLEPPELLVLPLVSQWEIRDPGTAWRTAPEPTCSPDMDESALSRPRQPRQEVREHGTAGRTRRKGEQREHQTAPCPGTDSWQRQSGWSSPSKPGRLGRFQQGSR